MMRFFVHSQLLCLGVLFTSTLFVSSLCCADNLVSPEFAALNEISDLEFQKKQSERRRIQDAEAEESTEELEVSKGYVSSMMSSSRFSLTRIDAAVTFSPPISRLLLMAGHDLTATHNREWMKTSRFEDEEFYHSTFRWKMERELKKNMPSRNVSYRESIDQLHRRIRTHIVTKRRAKRVRLRDHF